MKRMFILLALASGCGGGIDCPANGWTLEKRYELNFTEFTSNQIAVDTSDLPTDTAAIANAWNTLQSCLAHTIAADPAINKQVALNADCRMTDAFTLRTTLQDIHYCPECFGVKIASDYIVDDCAPGAKQALPIVWADRTLCEAPDKHIPPQCPCRSRVETQRDILPEPGGGSHFGNVIVVPPNMELLRAEFARNITGCNNVWIVPQIVACLP